VDVFQKVQKMDRFFGGEKKFFCNGPSGPFFCFWGRNSEWFWGIFCREEGTAITTNKDGLFMNIWAADK